MPSRQREWQKRMQAEQRCVVCGKPSVTKLHCEKHRLICLEQSKRRQAALVAKGLCVTCGKAPSGGGWKRLCDVCGVMAASSMRRHLARTNEKGVTT